MDSSVDYQKVEMPRVIIPVAVGFSVLAVGFLFWLIYGREASTGYDVAYLAGVNASLNAASAFCLFAGFFAIRGGHWKRHRNFMLLAVFFSALFLVSYIVYHTFHGDTRFLGQGLIRPVYFFILISHIVLSVVALPVILITVSLSVTRRFAQHRKWARWAFPLWAYVSLTGVAVFFLLKAFGS
ncbi:MAG: DUF420 domain-containing protein [Vulcanimicrobiota bacterium]